MSKVESCDLVGVPVGCAGVLDPGTRDRAICDRQLEASSQLGCATQEEAIDLRPLFRHVEADLLRLRERLHHEGESCIQLGVGATDCFFEISQVSQRRPPAEAAKAVESDRSLVDVVLDEVELPSKESLEDRPDRIHRLEVWTYDAELGDHLALERLERVRQGEGLDPEERPIVTLGNVQGILDTNDPSVDGVELHEDGSGHKRRVRSSGCD